MSKKLTENQKLVFKKSEINNRGVLLILSRINWDVFEKQSCGYFLTNWEDLPRVEKRTAKTMIKKGFAKYITIKTCRTDGTAIYNQGIKITSHGWDVYYKLI